MSTPDEIRADIARTRAELSDDVNGLTYEANPKTIAHRQVGKVRSAIFGVKDRVMGSDYSPQPSSSGAGSALSSVGGSISDATSAVGDKVSDTPGAIKSQTQGNPLAAGLVAFGVGALVGGLLPASAPERQVAQKVKEVAEPMADELKGVAKEAAESLQEPAQQAVDSVKSAASDAADTVKEQGVSAAQDVKGKAQDSTQKVQDSRS